MPVSPTETTGPRLLRRPRFDCSCHREVEPAHFHHGPEGLLACAACGQVWVLPGFDRERVLLFEASRKVGVPSSDELRDWFQLERGDD